MKNQIIKEHLEYFDMNLLIKRKTQISLKKCFIFVVKTAQENP